MPKRADIMSIVRQAVSEGRYVYSQHASERQRERAISDGDFRCAVANGWHEKRKDSWVAQHKSWNYALRGSSLSGERLRIAVNLDELDDIGVLVVTLINLDQ